MRRSILTRSVVGIATLAIGSFALAAVPATAATPSGVTRDTIVTVLDAAREGRSSTGDYSDAAEAAIIKLAQTSCAYTETEDFYLESTYFNLFRPGSADGALVTMVFHDEDPGDGQPTHTHCSFGVVVSSDKDATLSGQATLALTPRPFEEPPPITETAAVVAAADAPDSNTASLSGNAFVSPSITRDEFSYYFLYSSVTFAASGAASQPKTVTDQRKIWDHKSKVEKKAAKAKYDKRIVKAKKAYAKALDKAGSNTAKRAAAKKAYKAKRAETKVKYDYAVWNYRYVTSTKTSKQTTPFSLSATARLSDISR